MNNDAYNSGLGESLVHLVKMRAPRRSMGARIASMCIRKAAAPSARLSRDSMWKEAPFYSECERPALALTEAVTRITECHVPDVGFERARAHFNEQELIALVLTLTTINA